MRRSRPVALSLLAALAASGCSQRFARVPVDNPQAVAAQSSATPVGGVAVQTYPAWGGAMPPPFKAYSVGAPTFGAPAEGGGAVSGVRGVGNGATAR